MTHIHGGNWTHAPDALVSAELGQLRGRIDALLSCQPQWSAAVQALFEDLVAIEGRLLGHDARTALAFVQHIKCLAPSG